MEDRTEPRRGGLSSRIIFVDEGGAAAVGALTPTRLTAGDHALGAAAGEQPRGILGREKVDYRM